MERPNMIEGGHAWRGQAQGTYLDKVLRPEPWRITALGRKRV